MQRKLAIVSLSVAIGLIPSSLFAQSIPMMIFTSSGIYLSGDPEQQVKIGERLSLIDLGRRFPSCQVYSEYYNGDEEGVSTKIACEEVIVSIQFDEADSIAGFWSSTRGAAFKNNVQVDDPVVDAVGDVAYCSLCREDEPSYCKADEQSTVRYDVIYDDEKCMPQMVDGSDSCGGTHKIRSCVVVMGLGQIPPGF